MSIAISAVLAAAAVVFTLSGIPTTTTPPQSLLNALLSQQPLAAADASNALLYSALAYVMAFSGSLFVLRFLGLFAAALGIPNEEQIRRNRELARQNRIQADLANRQARLIARYIARAQQAAARRPIRTEPPR
jgi:hypothetical protein